MKQLFASLLLAVVAHQANATSIYEPFADATAYGGTPYPVGAYLATGVATSYHLTNGTGAVWSAVSNYATVNSTNIPVITNATITYPGMGPSPGNSLFIPPATNLMGVMVFSNIIPATTNVQWFYSFTLKVTDTSSLTTNNYANFFASFADLGRNSGVPVARADAYVVSKITNGGYLLGIGKSPPKPNGALAYDTTPRNVGDVLFIVGSYDYTTTNHPANLWINPATNTFGGATAPSPTVHVTGGNDLNAPGPVSFLLGCYTNPPPGCVVDDLRVAQSWALVTGAPDIHIAPAGTGANAGNTATFSVYASGANPLSYQWADSSGALSDGGDIVGSSTATLSITNSTGNNDDNYYVIVSNAYGAATSVSANLTVNDPWINVSPTNLTLPPQSTAVFNVVASGIPTLTYAWFKDGNALQNGGNISGAHAASLTVANISFTNSDAGGYSVYVTNGIGVVAQSSPGYLTITDPAIISSPQNSVNNYGTTATFQVTAAGQTTLSYRWYEDGVGALSDAGNISGTHSSILTIANVSYTNDGNYYAIVTDTAGPATSSEGSLTVIEPIITSQPSSATDTQGTAAVFSVSAIGAPTINYQWEKNGGALNDGGNIAGSHTANLTVSSLSASDAANYTVVVTDASGMSTNSAAAVLTVLTSPIITAQPSALTITPGNTAAFALGVTGAAPISYQWYSNSTSLASGTNFAYVITNVQLGMSGSFSVIASNSLGSVTSAVVPFSVAPSIQLYSSNLVVVRVGNGAQSQQYTGNSVFLDQLTTNGTYLDTVCIPDSGSSALIEIGPDVNGTTLTGTALSLSADGLQLVLSGYNTPQPYSAALESSTAGAVARGIGVITSTGQYTLAVSSHAAYPSTYFRGATSDGSNNFWGAGNTGGTYYFGNSAPATTIQSAYPNLRSVDFFNNNLYTVSGSSGGIGVFEWTGFPTNAVAPTELFIPNATPTDLAINPAGTIMYLGTSVGVLKYTFDGTYWNFAATISTYSVRYLTADFSGPAPIVYATTSDSVSDRLVSIVDNGSGSLTTLATAGVNQNLRGVRFGPLPAPAPPYIYATSAPGSIVLTWAGSYVLQASTNVATNYVDVPSATSPYTNAFTNAPQVFFRLRQGP